VSDQNIRKGLRDLRAVGPEYTAQLIGLEEIKKLSGFIDNARRFAEHHNGRCRHCYPRIWNTNDQEEAEREQNAFVTEAGAVVSHCCKPGGLGHGWCSNRNWTETSCSCECHCFVKRFYEIWKLVKEY